MSHNRKKKPANPASTAAPPKESLDAPPVDELPVEEVAAAAVEVAALGAVVGLEAELYVVEVAKAGVVLKLSETEDDDDDFADDAEDGESVAELVEVFSAGLVFSETVLEGAEV